MSQLISTTAMSGMRAIGAHADRSLVRVQSLLDREFKGGLSFALADPVPRHDGAGIDWYVETEEKLTRLTNLDSDPASIHRQRLRDDFARLAEKAAEYETRKETVWISTASALRSAATYPGEDYVWVAGDPSSPLSKVVITGWGYEAYTPTHGVSGIVARMQTASIGADASNGTDERSPAAEPDLPPHEPRFRTGQKPSSGQHWHGFLLPLVLWLLAISLALAIGWRLIPACGVRLPGGVEIYGFGGGEFCRRLGDPAFDAGKAQNKAQTTALASLERKLREFIATCAPTPAAPAADELASDAARNTAKEALEEIGIRQNLDETTLTLIWHSKNDLDIQAICPDGQLVKVGEPLCRGKVDHDDNGSASGSSPLIDDPVEHLTWKTTDMMPGTYKVLVRHYQNPSRLVPSEFSVILQRGDVYEEVKGRSTYQDLKPMEIMQFEVP